VICLDFKLSSDHPCLKVSHITFWVLATGHGGKMKRAFTGLVTVLLGASVVFGIASYLHVDNRLQKPVVAQVRGTAQTSQGVLPHAFIALNTYPDDLAGANGPSGGTHPDWVAYGPSSAIVLPAHALVTMTITQYDSGGTINNAFFSKVAGTVATPGDGTTANQMLLDGKPISSIDPTAVGHTFTLHDLTSPSQTSLFVSVPLPAVADSAIPTSGYTKTPHVVTFSFITGSAGKYIWNCEYPCGDGTYRNFGNVMSARGYMSGTVTVA
jgi:hypothetical protein